MKMFLACYSCERSPKPGDPDVKPGVTFEVHHGSSIGLMDDAELYRLAILADLIASKTPGGGWTRHVVKVTEVEPEIIERAAAAIRRSGT